MLIGDIIKKYMSSSKIVLSDSFNRADNATALGNADTGQTWTIVSGGVMGILNNQVYQSASTFNSFALIESLKSDCKVSVDIVITASDKPRLVFRSTNNPIGDDWEISTNATSYLLKKRVATTQTTMATIVQTPQNGDNVAVVLNGANIDVYINGILKASVTDSANMNNTIHGMSINYSSSVRLDNFKVEGL